MPGTDGRRRSIEVEGFGHAGLPIPAACRIGNIVMTGGISGIDVDAQRMPESAAEQCENMFANVRRILAAAGASPDDVIKMTVFVKDRTVRSVVNGPWIAMFPDEHSRPARHILEYESLQGGMVIQCEVTAVV
jgi:2-iminobutanoate/2-iminopropanoate deaminase